LIYLGLRMMRAREVQPPRRVIGPDDDPEFLWRINRGPENPNNPRDAQQQ